MREILINNPTDGEWIMLRVGGVFNEKTDHCIGLHRDGVMQGGVVFTGYLHASIMIHMAGNETNWATKDFLWMVFDYAFVQLGCRKLVGLVPARNSRAIAVDLKLGFRIEYSIAHLLPDPDEDVFLMTMEKEQAAKWLRLVPERYRSNREIKWVS